MRSLVLASLFVSASAIACPDLSGNYPVCRSNSDSSPDQNMVMTQAVVNGATVYTSTSTDSVSGETTTDSLAADGKEVEVTADIGEMPLTIKYTATCSGEALVMDAAMSIEGQSIGTVKSTITKEGNALVTRTSGNVMGEDVAEEVVCE